MDDLLPKSRRAPRLTLGIHATVLMALVTLAFWILMGGWVADRLGPAWPSNLAVEEIVPAGWSTVRSTASRRCLQVVSDRTAVRSAQERLLILYEGQPESAYLVLSSCGVGAGKNHTVYLNGQPVAQVQDDSYATCICDGSARQITYRLDNPTLVVSGWNDLMITNDADVRDTWIAYGAQLVIQGELTGALKAEFSFISSHDGSRRLATYKVPVSNLADRPVPLLVSIGGTGEDRWDALYHYAERTNAAGWLLLAPEVRQIYRNYGGRTASLATQRDIMDAIQYMVGRFSVDTDRIYISGFSAGGGVAAMMGAKYPHVFAGVVDWIGPTDFRDLIEQRPDLYDSLVANDFGCPPTGSTVACTFEWQRRSVREMVVNLKHVPMAIVHGRADESIPFAQSEDFYEEMSKFFDPAAYNKVAVWHDGGHHDPVPSMRPLQFMAQFTLNTRPQDIAIRTDESKDFYWVHVLQKDWRGAQVPGFSNVVAFYDLASGFIDAEVWDERAHEGGNLPLDITIDLRAMGLKYDVVYIIEDRNVATGALSSRRATPVDGRLLLSVPRDLLGQVHHQYQIYPLSSVGNPWHLPRRASAP